MPSYTFLRSIHNKWLQQSGNHGNDLFSPAVNDKIQAVIQMTCYRAYLKDSLLGTGLSKQELRLRAATWANAWLGGSLATFKLPKSPYQLFA
jgi:hypothetical protein